MMLSPAFTTTMAYDPAGNQFQMTYPTIPGTALYHAYPVGGSPDPRNFELIENRVFVGGFPATTQENDLRTFFEKFGQVREVKVIRSSEGASKGYGFITYSTEQEAKTVIQLSSNHDSEKLEFRGRRLNLGPAYRRIIHGPRFPPEYAIATPTGQLLAASPFGGVTYAYPQPPYVMVPPNQVQPFVCSPVSNVAPAQYTLPNSDIVNTRAQQIAANNGGAPVMLVPNAGTTISPHDSPRTNGIGAQPPHVVNSPVHVAAGQPQQQQQQAYSITPSGMQQIAQVTQPLTPITPSINAQRAAIFPQGPYYPPAAPPNDMTHYSQMTAPTYFFAPNGYQTVDTNGQPAAAMALPSPNPIAQLVPHAVAPMTPQTPQPCYYDESMIGGWQNPAEVRQTSTPRRSPMKSVISLTNPLGPVSLQQYDRKDANTVNGAPTTGKQFP